MRINLHCQAVDSLKRLHYLYLDGTECLNSYHRDEYIKILKNTPEFSDFRMTVRLMANNGIRIKWRLTDFYALSQLLRRVLFEMLKP